jgi:hypothetical protein
MIEILKRLDVVEKQVQGLIKWSNSFDNGMAYRRFASPEIAQRLRCVEESLADLERAIGIIGH